MALEPDTRLLRAPYAAGLAPARVRAWLIRGVSHANSAATFWAALLGEADACFPGCDNLTLRCLSDISLTRNLLFPVHSLEEFLNRPPADPADALARTAAELDLLGPPAAVHLSVSRGGDVLYGEALPLDAVDAEILPFLLAWLLEWAGVPESQWAQASVAGSFEALDQPAGCRRRVAFALRQVPAAEGLVDRMLRISGPAAT